MKQTWICMTLLLAVLSGCATDLKDDDYIEAMKRQDEEAFQRHMDIR
ncbi:MAG: hypothetical protein AAF649_11650 [Verrucomicrobiota bacterium]